MRSVRTLLLLLTACRGPGSLQGTVEGRPFEVRQARLIREEHRLIINAQDQLTECAQRVKRGRVVRLVLEFEGDALPSPGMYELADAGSPGVTVERLSTNDACAIDQVVRATAAKVELVEVRVEPRSLAVETDFRLHLTFFDDVLDGSLRATLCGGNFTGYCDSN